MNQARDSVRLFNSLEKALDSMNLQGTTRTLLRRFTTQKFGDILKATNSQA